MPAPDVLAALETHFHDMIRHRAGDLVDQHDVPLPDLVASPPTGRPSWMAVPGMYGGFAYHLAPDNPPRLIVESWNRIVAGSGQRHEVTADGWRLVDEGFV